MQKEPQTKEATDSRLQSEKQSKNSMLNSKKKETWLLLEIKISALYVRFPFPKCAFLKDALLVKRNIMSNSYFLLILLPVGFTPWYDLTCLVPGGGRVSRLEPAQSITLELQLAWDCLCNRLTQKWRRQPEGSMYLQQLRTLLDYHKTWQPLTWTLLPICPF